MPPTNAQKHTRAHTNTSKTHTHTLVCQLKLPITFLKVPKISDNVQPVGGAQCGVKAAQSHFHTALHVSKRYA